MATATTTRRELATSDEIAAHLRMKRHAFLQLRHVGMAPPAVQIGRRLLWDWADVEAWLDARKSSGPARTPTA